MPLRRGLSLRAPRAPGCDLAPAWEAAGRVGPGGGVGAEELSQPPSGCGGGGGCCVPGPCAPEPGQGEEGPRRWGVQVCPQLGVLGNAWFLRVHPHWPRSPEPEVPRYSLGIP